MERYIVVHGKDNKIVGIVDLCYRINIPILSAWGGHIGYYVRLDEKRKGDFKLCFVYFLQL